MKKPKKKIIKAYEFFEVLDYIINKYHISSQEKRIFWNWLLKNDFEGINNGSYSYLEIHNNSNLIDDKDTLYFEEIENILKLLYSEYQEHEMYFWISW